MDIKQAYNVLKKLIDSLRLTHEEWNVLNISLGFLHEEAKENQESKRARKARDEVVEGMQKAAEEA